MKTSRTLIVVGALACALTGALTWNFLAEKIVLPANAQEPPRTAQCEWSYLQDNAAPEIGKNGEVQLPADWLAMKQGGWHMIGPILVNPLAAPPNIYYIFERCN